ncbi:MAG: ABC transporter ATP-binding protein [Planctomycetota bacterium]|nr:ABC transporter ATP-binding protein [Planctomycetota bacterium]
MTRTAIQPVDATFTERAPAVRVQSLSKVIDDRPILHEISFEVPDGRYVALLGANGAGKSTLLKVLATLILPTAGEVFFFGRSQSRDTVGLRSKLGMIGHGAMLYRDLTALENLVFFGRLYRVADPGARARELLEYVGLASRADDPVKTFSRGMVQRVSIARALMHDPDLLLADEPFAGLDAPSRAMLEAFLERLHDEGKTIILANHDIAQSLALAGQVLVLRAGRLVVDRLTNGLEPDTILAEVAAS